MNKTKLVGALFLLTMTLLPIANAFVTEGMGLDMTYTTEPFEPMIWGCDDFLLTDDPLESGRVSGYGDELIERQNSYIFEGEQLAWQVLVLDKNGIEKVSDIYVTVDGEIQANCNLDYVLPVESEINPACNARLDEELFLHPPASNTMAYYTCIFTAEPREYMHGSLPIEAEVIDLSGKTAATDETLYYFFNPAISLIVNGALDFGQNVRPGTSAYSPTISVESNAEGGVRLDMFVVGTDFYDPTNSGAKCPNTNKLSLSALNYYVAHGAYSSFDDGRADTEGYLPINYCEGAECQFTRNFYGANEVLQADYDRPYYLANILTPGDNMALTFRLDLPVPCNGDFTSGSIYLMGEAI